MSALSVKGAILAGGTGKRLRPVSYYIQKAMIPVGASERPVLEFVIRLFHLHGIRRIVLLLGYKARQVINYFDDGGRFGVELEYSIDSPGYEGNGGALLNAYLNGHFEDADTVLVYYGDILSDLNLRELVECHTGSGAHATVVLARRYQVPVGVAEVDSSGRILRLLEKPWLDIDATMGILALDRTSLEDLAEMKRRKIDIMEDFVPHLIAKGRLVRAFFYNGKWYDVGSIERLEKIDVEWLKGLELKLLGEGKA
uniref:Nucleotidyltransferase family protein n=1 Tax=Fervidicoccus fontis TaxID=683846 RepID=A0A7J3ZJ00_9CREN